MNRLIQALIIAAIVATVGSFAFLGLSDFSLTNIQGAGGTFYTDSSFTPYAEYTENAELYGNTIRVEDYHVESGTEKDVGRIHIGDWSKEVDMNERVKHNGITVKIHNGRDTVLYEGGYSSELENYISLAWGMNLDISNDTITADIDNISTEEVSPGQHKINFDLNINNRWLGDLKSDNIYVEGFNKKLSVPTNKIEKGETEYSLVMKSDNYDPSEYRVDRTIESELQLVAEDPWIPMDQKYFGGAEVKENPDFGLDTIRFSASNVSIDLQYCGENASYSSGSCEIDNELHLRGDSCFLPSGHSMYTQSFTEGSYKVEDFEPNPSYFCTRHPAEVLNGSVQTGTSTDVYRSVVNNGEFEVPSGTTMNLFWIADSTETVKICEEGSYNSTSDKCVATPSIVHKCSDNSVWSPETGACVVNPETKAVCTDEDARYNSKVDKCVKEIDGTSCPVGSVSGPEGDVCYSEASVEKVCPNEVENGVVKNGKCLSEAEVTLVQRNIIGDFTVAIENTTDAIADFFYSVLPI